jgi:O-antigen ligase
VFVAIATIPPTLAARLQTPESGKVRTQLFLMILFFGFAVCSWFPHGGLRANLTSLQNLAPNIIVYFLALVHLRTPSRLHLVRVILVLVAIFVLAMAFSQIPLARAGGESTPYVQYSGDETNPDLRITGLGLMSDPNILGQFLLLILPLLFVSNRETGLGPKYFLIIPLTVLFLVGVYNTGSRGAVLGLGMVVGLYIIYRYKTTGKLIAAVFGSVTLVLINTVGARKVSITGGMDRLAIWSDGMAFFKSSPLWGIGFGGFVEREQWTAHNSYLLCAAELGFLGLFLWVSVLVVTVIQLNQVPKLVGKSNPALARWAVGMKVSLGGYLLTSYFLSCTYAVPLFLLLGMSGGIIAAAGGDEAMPLHGTRWPLWAFALSLVAIISIYVMLRLRVV